MEEYVPNNIVKLGKEEQKTVSAISIVIAQTFMDMAYDFGKFKELKLSSEAVKVLHQYVDYFHIKFKELLSEQLVESN